jgi:transposase
MDGLSPLHRRVAGIDVHLMLHVITVLAENEDGTITKYQPSFGGFKRDMRAMVLWLLGLGVELVVMESTGIYWKSAYSHLERAGIPALVVNARFIKRNYSAKKLKIKLDKVFA